MQQISVQAMSSKVVIINTATDAVVGQLGASSGVAEPFGIAI
jgi:hypothetical protein